MDAGIRIKKDMPIVLRGGMRKRREVTNGEMDGSGTGMRMAKIRHVLLWMGLKRRNCRP